MPLPAGTRFGPYELLSALGAGGTRDQGWQIPLSMVIATAALREAKPVCAEM